MIKQIFFLLGIFLTSLVTAGTPDTILANNSLIEYTGRIDFAKPMAPSFSYSGVSIRASFQGTSIAMILDDPGTGNFYNVIIDKIVLPRLKTKKGLNTYEIKTNLKDTIHEIELFRLTEEMFGKTSFKGFLIDKGRRLVVITNKREHLIEFIGNSITCGYGNEGGPGEHFGPTTENHYLTYAAITSRSFHARHLAVCKSGIGIYRNYDGPVSGSKDCMTNFYERIFLYDSLPLYGFSQKPDLICIDLGTNDFSTGKGDSARYVNKYLQFIDLIQAKNKDADILVLLGPMLSGADLGLVRRCLHFVVESINRKNHGKVYFFEMSQQNGELGYGTDSHPTVAQHLKNARELVKYISALKDWKIYKGELK
jgi:lysophospholipase L1-like esterase